jgi:hypothetical protein
MAAWWDRWLRGAPAPEAPEPTAVWFTPTSHRPEPDLDTVPGEWRADVWPSPRSSWVEHPLIGRLPYVVKPDVGVAAWISCAGHLPWGQPLDQRHDDADSLTWELDPDGLEIAGHPRVSLSLTSSAPVALLSVKLQDVASDGTSTLVTRGVLNLTRRAGMASPEPLVAGQVYDVEIELEATAYRWRPGHVLRLAVAGTDWPNVAAPPAPVTLEVRSGVLALPAYEPAGSMTPPDFVPGEETSSESAHGVVWRVERDVLARTTTCVTGHGGHYDVPYGSVVERYESRVQVSTRTFEQLAASEVSTTLRYADDGSGSPVSVSVRAALELFAGASSFDVRITLTCREGDDVVAERLWQRQITRDLA